MESAPVSSSNVIKRLCFGFPMFFTFLGITMLGPFMLICLVLLVQILCFKEILTVIYNRSKIPSTLPYFRSLSWYFLIVANYFCATEIIAPHFQISMKYHRFVALCAYFIGVVIFILNIIRKYDKKQFKILAWIHVFLLILVAQSYMIIQNIFTGLIWVILPILLVVGNDTFSYLCGQMWGKTPLIKLSPKKTWEGFVGGAVMNIVIGFFVANSMWGVEYLTCPVEYQGMEMKNDCSVDYLLKYPFTYHFLVLALFANVIAPFGGFWASGFKRAFGVKDFGDAIPGHGGIMDRCDCQFFMGTFVNVYIFTFIKKHSVDVIFDKILQMDEDGQVQFYYMLKRSLEDANLMNITTVSDTVTVSK